MLVHRGASRRLWTKRVERWRESGLSANEFATELGVNAATLAQWKYRLAAEAQAEMPGERTLDPAALNRILSPRSRHDVRC